MVSITEATGGPNPHRPNPQVPSSAITCTQLTPPPIPGWAPGSRENSGYLFKGNARGDCWLQEGRRPFDFGGACGLSIWTRRMDDIFMIIPGDTNGHVKYLVSHFTTYWFWITIPDQISRPASALID